MLIFLLLGLFLSAMVFLITYNALYNHHIQKNWKNGAFIGRRWPSPHFLTLIFIIVLLFFGMLFCVCNLYNPNQEEDTIISEINEYSANELSRQYPDLYANAMKTGSLGGYEKYEKRQHDFHYVYYISTEKYDPMHPSLILFIEYLGDTSYEYYTSREDLYVGKGNHHGRGQGQTMTASPYYCVIVNGNLDSFEYMDYEAAFYTDEKLQEEDFDNDSYEHAVVTEKIRLERRIP